MSFKQSELFYVREGSILLPYLRHACGSCGSADLSPAYKILVVIFYGIFAMPNNFFSGWQPSEDIRYPLDF